MEQLTRIQISLFKNTSPSTPGLRDNSGIEK